MNWSVKDWEGIKLTKEGIHEQSTTDMILEELAMEDKEDVENEVK